MSYIFLQEQGEVSSVDNFSDIPQYVLSKLRNTQDKSCCNDNETECCPSSQSGTMSAPLTESPGEEQLMLFAEDFRAKTSVPQERELALQESVLDYGQNMQESLTRCGLSLSSRKTPRYCGVAGLTLSSETCPSWGMMQSGACWELGTSARPIKGTGCGSWLTPTVEDAGRQGSAEDWKKYQENGQTSAARLRNQVKAKQTWPTPATRDYKGGHAPRSLTRKDGKTRMDILPNVVAYGGKTTQQLSQEKQDCCKSTLQLNPTWVEWLMGWPIEWTDLKPLETGKYQQWQQLHGIYFHNKE